MRVIKSNIYLIKKQPINSQFINTWESCQIDKLNKYLMLVIHNFLEILHNFLEMRTWKTIYPFKIQKNVTKNRVISKLTSYILEW